MFVCERALFIVLYILDLKIKKKEWCMAYGPRIVSLFSYFVHLCVRLCIGKCVFELRVSEIANIKLKSVLQCLDIWNTRMGNVGIERTIHMNAVEDIRNSKYLYVCTKQEIKM